MSASRARALSYLAYRALLAHPLKRLRQRGTGKERFLANYASEGLTPTTPEERRVGELASACIACGLCDAACDLANAVPAIRSMGLHAVFRLYSRSSLELPWAAPALDACAACTGRGDGRDDEAPAPCDSICPTGVPIARVVDALRERLAGYPRSA